MSSALITDFYQLTMMQGYFEENMHETKAVFDLYFRSTPFGGSYAVFAGLEPALRFLRNMRFTTADITYLNSLGLFSNNFLKYLKEFRFRGKIIAFKEGEIVFPSEPLLTIEANLLEAQLVETVLLNIINFQTLIATKSSRMVLAAGKAIVVDFGLRRAQGLNGGVSASRAAYIGGAQGTSNVQAAQMFNIQPVGTQAHSWIMCFESELDAFRAYARIFPNQCTLLLDTYDVVRSGLPNAIVVAKELREKGYELSGVRIDSGDLSYLSRYLRKALDSAGFPDVKIVVSSDLDEHVINSINMDAGCVDVYGVGTRLITGAGEGGGALGGVYKLVEINNKPCLKISNEPRKITLPSKKKIYRYKDEKGTSMLDVIALNNEDPKIISLIYDPKNPLLYTTVEENWVQNNIRDVVMEDGKICTDFPNLKELAQRCKNGLAKMPEGTLRLHNSHIYKVAITKKLHDLRIKMLEEIKDNIII